MVANDIRSAYHGAKWAIVLRGIFSLAIGILILTRPLASVAALALVIAIWALIDGIVNIVHAFHLRDLVPKWWVLLLGGVISAVFGAAALYYYPSLSLAFAVVWTAFWLISIGVIGSYVAVLQRQAGAQWGWTMVFGVLAIVAGILAFAFPGATLASLLGIIAAFAIVSGIVLLMAAGKMQSLEHDAKAAARAVRSA